MRILRTLLLASPLLLLPMGAAHAETPARAASAPPAAAPARSAAPAPATAEPAATGDTAAPPATASKLPPLRTDDAVAGGIGLASLVVGVALVGAAAGIQGSLGSSAPRDPLGRPTCSSSGAGDGGTTADLGDCASLRDKASLGTDLGNAGVTLMITGGLLAGAAAAYWLLSSPSPAKAPKAARSAPPPTLRVAPAVGATFGGLVVVGSF